MIDEGRDVSITTQGHTVRRKNDNFSEALDRQTRVA